MTRTPGVRCPLLGCTESRALETATNGQNQKKSCPSLVTLTQQIMLESAEALL